MRELINDSMMALSRPWYQVALYSRRAWLSASELQLCSACVAAPLNPPAHFSSHFIISSLFLLGRAGVALDAAALCCVYPSTCPYILCGRTASSGAAACRPRSEPLQASVGDGDLRTLVHTDARIHRSRVWRILRGAAARDPPINVLRASLPVAHRCVAPLAGRRSLESRIVSNSVKNLIQSGALKRQDSNYS